MPKLDGREISRRILHQHAHGAFEARELLAQTMAERGLGGELERLVVDLANEVAGGVSGARACGCAGERQHADAHKSFQRSHGIGRCWIFDETYGLRFVFSCAANSRRAR